MRLFARRELALAAPLILTTPEAADRIGRPARGLEPWREIELPAEPGRRLTITAVPARHGPPGSEGLTGRVCGFVTRGTQMPGVYASGDNTSLEVVKEIAARLGGIEVALINAGAAQLPYIGEGHLTLSAKETLEAARILAAGRVIPLHHEGWAHYTEGRTELREVFDGTELEDALELPGPTDS